MTSKPPFAVGDEVTTYFRPREGHVVRRVVEVRKAASCRTGWQVSADEGDTCSCCSRKLGGKITFMDSSWFEKADV